MLDITFASLSVDTSTAITMNLSSANSNFSTPIRYNLTSDMEFGALQILSICCYSSVFVLSSLGNVTMLLILLRNLRKTKLNRVYILLLNLNVADLIVTFLHMPKEIAHAVTVQWWAPDWMCRLSKYMDVFGIYLSSNILICMSIDRFFAIVRPLDNFKARRRVRIMVILAWFLAACSSLPQLYTFSKAYHPDIHWYSQCISVEYVGGVDTGAINYVLLNTVLTGLEVYILPFVVIVFCYATIMSTIVNEEKHINRGAANLTNSDNNEPQVQLRRSSHCYIRRAKSKTLRMTVVIVATFLICWTPYFIMVVLHFVDLDFRIGARRNFIVLPPLLERFFYVFAIFNSCINPYLYGYYSFKLRLELKELGKKCCGRRPPYRSSRYYSPGSPTTFFVDHQREARYSRGLSLDLSHNENHMVRFREGLLNDRSTICDSDHSQ